jgi:HlyD family secretion protein
MSGRQKWLALAALFLAACARDGDGGLAGYVEADLLYLAPQDAGIVKSLAVKEGDRVEKGAVVFTLDPTRASLAAEQATASAASAAARAAENGALEQQIAEAEAGERLARQNYQRSRRLLEDGVITRARLDADEAALRAAEARLERARAERAAMLREWESWSAAARLAERRLADLATEAPAAGTIERIYRRPGEVVAAGDPVVALLPPENLKLRFFTPEPRLAAMRVGAEISFSCDGCGARRATISYVAAEPQFTPPVIYSVEERDKLVFLTEARPADPSGLRPGLPVTIALAPAP